MTESLSEFEIMVDEDDVSEYLGIPKYRYGVAESQDRVGWLQGLQLLKQAVTYWQ